MKQTTKYLILILFLFIGTTPSIAQRHFTNAEQTQISVPTRGLFSRVSRFYIDFREPNNKAYSFPLPVGRAQLMANQALKITTKPGDIVLSMFPGTVRMARKTPQYGNVVVVRHNNGLETVYGNNAQNLVKIGQHVRAGQKVAIVGSKGGSTYCLFAIMVNGGWINPSTILNYRSHRLRRQKVEFQKVGNRVKVAVLAKSNKITSLDPNDEIDDIFKDNATFRLDLEEIEHEHWSYPLAGSHVISPYGRRGRRRHSGVDIKTRPNDKVLAAFDGVVEQSGPYYGYGNYIVIRHAYGFKTCYSHQSKNFVRRGQRVKAGQVIGLTGRTGRATTAHLHFEVRFKGRAINPAILFDHANHRLKAKIITIGKNGSIR